VVIFHLTDATTAFNDSQEQKYYKSANGSHKEFLRPRASLQTTVQFTWVDL